MVDELIRKLQDPSPGVRLDAAWRITRMPKPAPAELVGPLIDALHFGSDYAFGMVIFALGHTKDERAYHVLTGYLRSKEPYHRALAAQALGKYGDSRAVGILIPLLDDSAHAWTEDHGPDMTVADVVREAIRELS